jgi:hypothetical protein
MQLNQILTSLQGSDNALRTNAEAELKKARAE